MELGPEAPQWPHNQEPSSVAEMNALEEALAPAPTPSAVPDLSDVPRLTNGLLAPAVIPPLDAGHLPDLSGELQARREKDQPDGYPGLDKNGKLSPYVLPMLAKGLQGEQGKQGEQGNPGNPGPQGREGRVGPPGPPGRQGDPGATGPQGARGAAADMTGVLRVPADPPTLHLNSETLARDLAYRLAELGLIKLA